MRGLIQILNFKDSWFYTFYLILSSNKHFKKYIYHPTVNIFVLILYTQLFYFFTCIYFLGWDQQTFFVYKTYIEVLKKEKEKKMKFSDLFF